jgi:hypothetical protein
MESDVTVATAGGSGVETGDAVSCSVTELRRRGVDVGCSVAVAATAGTDVAVDRGVGVFWTVGRIVGVAKGDEDVSREAPSQMPETESTTLKTSLVPS